MRLIDADALETKSKTIYMEFDNVSVPTRVIPISDLYLAPAIDAVPVRHGRWENKTEERHGLYDYRFDCSVCEHIFWAAAVRDFNYCPNCGAKMDEEVGG